MGKETGIVSREMEIGQQRSTSSFWSVELNQPATDHRPPTTEASAQLSAIGRGTDQA